jgi:alpha-glucosidase
MLSDLPTAYEKEQESVDFITSIPTTWDQTIPLDGKVGEFLSVARKKGEDYYVGAMTNWTPRDLNLDFSFLPDGELFDAVIFQDGINADKNAIDYKRLTQTVKKGDQLKVHLAPGGGWAATLTRK